MSSRNAIYLLALHEQHTSGRSKGIVTSAARDYARWYNVPRAQQFSTRAADGGHCTPLSGTSFARMTLRDKLIIVGHGSTTSIGAFHSAWALCSALAGWGLTSAGVITFKACLVGADGFLDSVNRACDQHNITVGWLKGYTGSATTTTKGAWLLNVFGGILSANGIDTAVDNLKPVERITKRTGAHAQYRAVLVAGRAANQVARPSTHGEYVYPF